MKTKKERNSLKEDKIQEQKLQELNDKELENVSGGMKIVIDDVQLDFAARFVDIHIAGHDHGHPVFQPALQTARAVPGKHHNGKRCIRIFQRKIDMSAGLIPEIGDFPLYGDPVQQEILREHIFDIAVDLSDRVDLIHSHPLQILPARRLRTWAIHHRRTVLQAPQPR